MNTDLLLPSMSDHKDMNKVSKTIVKSHKNHQKEIPLNLRTIVPSDLHQIQPISTQVWNYDKIGSTPAINGTSFCVPTSYFKGN